LAKQYLEAYVEWIRATTDNSFDEAVVIAKSNLAYYAGYGSHELRKRVEKLFNCSHPVFGSAAEMGRPTGTEALQCGMQSKTLKQLRDENKS